jgi:hypothetical protein
MHQLKENDEILQFTHFIIERNVLLIFRKNKEIFMIAVVEKATFVIRSSQ